MTDSVVASYVQALGTRLAEGTSRANLPWQFKVIDSKDVNAFALPGGFVYVNRGLIERSDRMDELAGALGHEIGHVVRRHSVEQLKRSGVTRAGIDPEGIPSLFRVVLAAREQQPGLVQTFFASHPLEEDRIDQTQRLVERIDPTIEGTLSKDEDGFQVVKRRLAELPAR